MIAIRNYLNKKAQGIIEYALLLAFVVGIGMMLSGSNLGGAVNSVFNDVASELGLVRNYASAVKNWGSKSKDELYKIENKERLSIDQEALDNLAGFFIGKSRTYMKSLFVNDNLANTNKNFNLGWLQNDGKEGTVFIIQGENYETEAQNEINNHIFNWLQGDYGTFNAATGKIDPDSYKKNYVSGTKYLYSDYALGNDEGKTFQNGKDTYNRGGVKVKLKYENDTVVAAKVVIDSLNKGKSTSNSHDYSYGLNSTVYNDGTKNNDNNFQDFK